MPPLNFLTQWTRPAPERSLSWMVALATTKRFRVSLTVCFERRLEMTVERSILLIVGLIVLASTLLAAFSSPNWLWLTGIMGAHLIQASFTGLCPVVMTLKKLGLPTKAGFA